MFRDFWTIRVCRLAGPFFLGILSFAARASLVLDEPLQGSTSGTRSGGTFVSGGWQVTGKDDTIYWHVATITNGAAEFDVRGLNPNECRPGMEDKVELIEGRRYHLPDGSDRFLVDEAMLLRVTAALGGELFEPIKTTLVQNMRAMTTWCARKR